MRWRVLLIASLLVNAALVAGLLFFKRAFDHQVASADLEVRQPVITNRPIQHVVVRRQFFTWRTVESSDYPTYIANLRDIGCPESTIRDIIVADVNQLYALKRATEIVTAEQQWWRTEPDPEVVAAAQKRLRDLDEERRALLTRLLGPNWDLTEATVAASFEPRLAIALDGPVLGALSADLKATVREITARQQQRLQAYLETRRADGKLIESAELARIQQTTREELAAVLSPAQLEEYLLRYSSGAEALRAELGELRFFNASADEFRAMFRARDQFDQQIRLSYSGDDQASVTARKALEEQREQALRTALGEARYAEFTRLQDPLYRNALALATQAGSPKSAQALWEISKATAAERERLELDDSLSDTEREIELKKLELEQLKANAQALGRRLPPEPQPAPPRPVVHVMRPGDTLGVLSWRYGVSIQEIMAANPGHDFTRLQPGTSLVVPRSPDRQGVVLPGR